MRTITDSGRRTIVCTLIIAAVLLGAASSATAARVPHVAEAELMVDSLDTSKLDWLTLAQIDSMSTSCARVLVSTTNPGWGSVDLQRCTGIMSWFTTQKVDGEWMHSETLGGELLECPWSSIMPLAAQLDLGVCRKPRTTLWCHPAPSRLTMRMRPTACNTRGPSDAPARSANLVGLRWSRWGKPVATASGMDRGYGATPRSTPVTVTAYGREEHGMSGVGNYRYTKLRITAADGSSRFVVADA